MSASNDENHNSLIAPKCVTQLYKKYDAAPDGMCCSSGNNADNKQILTLVTYDIARNNTSSEKIESIE
ncbi:hypothetical protein N9383_02560 [Granulosicoccus sp.]|nr:hypothetical protein [Granulosicoccus sp.]